MTKKVLKTIIVLLFLLSPFYLVRAIEPLSVIINEIAWMGTEVSYNDEWIELYNNTDNSINLEGWVLKAEDKTPKINLLGTVPNNGFYLLERTDDDTVPAVAADLIYKGALGNNGEYLKLYNNSGNLVDEVNCSDGWFAGDNSTKQTMERTDSGWQDSSEPGGTPAAENSSPPADGELFSESSREAEEKEKVETGSLPTYPSGVVLSEILPSPEGPDAENEWVEILNQNDFEVNISGWKIKDKEG